MNMHAIDYLVHFSNILMLLSYSVRDILWLRWFAVGAALTNIPYFLLQGTVLWPPVLWALVFTAINLYQIARLYLGRSIGSFTFDVRGENQWSDIYFSTFCFLFRSSSTGILEFHSTTSCSRSPRRRRDAKFLVSSFWFLG